MPLLKIFGRQGHGFFALPSIAVGEVCRSYGVRVVGEAKDCRESFFALTAELKVKHPAVAEITRAAGIDLFVA